MKAILSALVATGALAVVGYAADDPKLVSEAKVTETTARATALARVPHGTVKSEELEREKGHLIYSYDIQVAGKNGIDEVNVDAMTGRVLAVHHEGPKEEGKEARELRKAAARRKPPR